MTKSERTRIDYMPGSAALEALALAAAMFPDARPQALIDRLVITGLCALRWKAPALYGADRDKWQLSKDIRP
ncbi:hypothetical protein [Rhodoferax sp.]|uniref:hypothetical protein n=1 Tax=Rhodoferax sp. TaxID=50421 RepID=UPI0025E1E2C7|nr:hypothetical protein [Rhodoferax sp.]MCM2296040.1 hypothetical protein [Rhodoferax sp.]